MKVVQRQSGGTSTLDDLHPVLKRIYASRGVLDSRDLDLGLQDLLPPDSLHNIGEAADLLARTMADGQHILVVGDFDADGATSCALSLLCLRAMGHDRVDYLVPNRFEYGYGLTPEIVAVAREYAPDLIMTVDNGIASFEGVRHAREAGIEVLVTDHHLPADSLPEASCIVNPNQPDCGFPSKALAGVGVVFYLMTALRARLRSEDWFASRDIAEPNLAAFLDLVALGTVADVVPLDQNNRRLVKHGLSIIRSGRGRPGILALLDVAGRNPQTTVAGDLAFAAGPRLNAAGRLDDMSLGIECLLAEHPAAARQMALELDALNRDRKRIETDMQAKALSVLENLELAADGDVSAMPSGICLYDRQWHPGVVGILASRIKERYHRPCIIFADSETDGNGEVQIKGSARSIEGLHIRDLLDTIATRHPEILSRFGGHAMAAGLTIRLADFEAFSRVFEQTVVKFADAEILQQSVLTDGGLDADCMTLEFAGELREAGPWGQHFPEPLFCNDFAVVSSRVVGEKHLKLVLQLPGADSLIDAIAFNVEASLLASVPGQLSLLYRLDVNEFRGVSSPQLVVERILPSS